MELKYCAKFEYSLKNEGPLNFLRFWNDVNEYKKTNTMAQRYLFANKIYENYILKYDSPVKDELSM